MPSETTILLQRHLGGALWRANQPGHLHHRVERRRRHLQRGRHGGLLQRGSHGEPIRQVETGLKFSWGVHCGRLYIYRRRICLEIFFQHIRSSCCRSFNGAVCFLCGSAELSQAITSNGGDEACLSWAHSSALMFPTVLPSFLPFAGLLLRTEVCFLHSARLLSTVPCSTPNSMKLSENSGSLTTSGKKHIWSSCELELGATSLCKLS